MKKVCSVICAKFRNFNNSKISYISKKTLVLCIICIICSKCENGDEKIFKEEESILKILELIKTI